MPTIYDKIGDEYANEAQQLAASRAADDARYLAVKNSEAERIAGLRAKNMKDAQAIGDRRVAFLEAQRQYAEDHSLGNKAEAFARNLVDSATAIPKKAGNLIALGAGKLFSDDLADAARAELRKGMTASVSDAASGRDQREAVLAQKARAKQDADNAGAALAGSIGGAFLDATNYVPGMAAAKLGQGAKAVGAVARAADTAKKVEKAADVAQAAGKLQKAATAAKDAGKFVGKSFVNVVGKPTASMARSPMGKDVLASLAVQQPVHVLSELAQGKDSGEVMKEALKTAGLTALVVPAAGAISKLGKGVSAIKRADDSVKAAGDKAAKVGESTASKVAAATEGVAPNAKPGVATDAAEGTTKTTIIDSGPDAAADIKKAAEHKSNLLAQQKAEAEQVAKNEAAKAEKASFDDVLVEKEIAKTKSLNAQKEAEAIQAAADQKRLSAFRKDIESRLPAAEPAADVKPATPEVPAAPVKARAKAKPKVKAEPSAAPVKAKAKAKKTVFDPDSEPTAELDAAYESASKQDKLKLAGGDPKILDEIRKKKSIFDKAKAIDEAIGSEGGLNDDLVKAFNKRMR